MDLEVDRTDLHRCRVVDTDPPALETGQCRLRIDTFALTANNITYGVVGDAFRYWDFFPATEPGWGRIPVWGFADVVATTDDRLAEGIRVRGFLPMSTHLVVNPGRLDHLGFTDESPHRAPMAGAYNRYLRVDTDPAYDPRREAQHMLLWPLFFTAFLIDDFLDDHDRYGASTVVVSSASAKTAIGTAYLLARRGEVEVVGITSPGNVAFVEALGVYDRVVAYDEVASVPDGGDAVYVDIAGDSAVRAAVHQAYRERLAHSMAVGATHWEGATLAPGGTDLPGPPPAFFFAPDQIAKRTRDWGPMGLDERAGPAWRDFVAFTDGWLELQTGRGPDAVERAYRQLLEGRAEPRVGHILSMWPEGTA